jgi:catechol 2,3-dioxygenase-like lactoylglutathione lyase family enzyme
MDVDIISGIHHVTILGADIRKSRAFYEEVLGLTAIEPPATSGPAEANFIVGSSIAGSRAGLSVLADPGKDDHGPSASIGAIVFSTPPQTLGAWGRHFDERSVRVTGRAWAFDEEHLCFSDPDGLDLALVEDADGKDWTESPPVHAERALHPLRLHSVELHSMGAGDDLHRLLAVLGLALHAREGSLFRFKIGGPPPTAYIDVFSKPRAAPWPVAQSAIRGLALEVGSAEALAALEVTLAESRFDVERPRSEDPSLWVRLPSAFGLVVALGLPDQRVINRTIVNHED